MDARRIRIGVSNRLDPLLADLAAWMAETPLPPDAAETVIVQSQGMRRWVTLELARRLGCAASLRMPFPGAFCHRLAALARGGADGEETPFRRETLAWRLYALPDELLDASALAPVRAYLAGSDPTKRFAWARRTAALFDDYQIYRPRMLLAWEAGRAEPDALPHAEWQAALWRWIVQEHGGDHLARRFLDLTETLETCAEPPPFCPPRIAVFGVSTLPPVFLGLLRALARNVPVRIYAVSPTTPERAGAKNRLLDSLAGQSDAFFGMLHELEADGASWEEIDLDDSGPGSALATLRADILHRVDRRPAGEAPPLPLEAEDDSVEIHDCHSPQREMEVLRDRLLAAFADDPTLRPHEVLVLLADVEGYAPAVEAVFGAPPAGAPALPYRIADRTAAAERPAAAAFLELLALAEGRATAAELMDLLERPPVRAAAGIPPAALPDLRDAVRALGIRWGVDGEDVLARGLPPGEAHTWRHGLDRMLLGYATGPVDALAADLPPWGGETTAQMETRGRFADWAERLFEALRALAAAPRLLDAWRGELLAAVEAFLAPDGEEGEEEIALLRHEIDAWADDALRAGTQAPVPLAAVRADLEGRLGPEGGGGDFLSGRLTFCAMKPMRTLPFRIIAVCGLQSGVFPRQDRPAAFDLIAAAPRRGDRSLRADDRQLFLETLLAARDRLWLFHTGRSARDGAPRAASPCLDEVLDALDRAFVLPDGRRPREALVRRHRLQPFHPLYFDGSDPRFFTYDGDALPPTSAPDAPSLPDSRSESGRMDGNDASASAGESLPPRLTASAFLPEPLPPAPAEETVSLGRLVEIVKNPARAFCRDRLGLLFEEEEEPLEERESLSVDGLARYVIENEMLRRRREGPVETEAEFRRLAAAAALPPGALGTAWYDHLHAETEPLAEEVERAAWISPAEIRIETETRIFVGRIDALTTGERLLVFPAQRKAKHRIAAWIYHLALNAAARAGADLPRHTRLLGRDGEERFAPPDDPLPLLEELARAAEAALGTPPPFFAESSFRYAATLAEGRDDPWKTALAVWQGSDYGGPSPERDDVYIATCFRGTDPVTSRSPAFAAWAERIFGPLLAHREETA